MFDEMAVNLSEFSEEISRKWKKTSSRSIFIFHDIVLYYPVLGQRNHGLSIEKGGFWNIKEKKSFLGSRKAERTFTGAGAQRNFLFHIIKSVKISATLHLK